jgi:predicted  nucleic acid-binding Zn-ribbon protein
MFRDLEFLLQLQEIDLRIHEQELAKEQLPATVRDLEQAVSKVQKGLEAAKNKLAEAEKELKNFDDKIFTAQQGLERSQERLNSIKTNREYDAVHAEIETQKNMVATSEGRKNKLTEEVNQLKAAVDVAQQELDKISSENAPVITDLKSKIEAIDSIIADIVKERDAVVPSITKSSMRTYDQIIKRRKTAKVISSVDHARTCTVCFKVLEPHIISEVRRSTQLILCQNCGSILVWTGNRGQGGAPEA